MATVSQLHIRVISPCGEAFNPIAQKIASYIETGQKIDQVKDSIYKFIDLQMQGSLTRALEGAEESVRSLQNSQEPLEIKKTEAWRICRWNWAKEKNEILQQGILTFLNGANVTCRECAKKHKDSTIARIDLDVSKQFALLEELGKDVVQTAHLSETRVRIRECSLL